MQPEYGSLLQGPEKTHAALATTLVQTRANNLSAVLHRFGAGEGAPSNCSTPPPSRCLIRRQISKHGHKVAVKSPVWDFRWPVPARELSFTSARRLIWAFACHLRQCLNHMKNRLVDTLLKSISRCVLPKRPGRIEPRAKKRRPKPLPLLSVPRSVAREQIRAQRA